MNMDTKLELIRNLIDSLNRLRFLGGGQAAAYQVVPGDFDNAVWKVFVFFPKIEYLSAVLLLLEDWKWCRVNAHALMLEITIY